MRVELHQGEKRIRLVPLIVCERRLERRQKGACLERGVELDELKLARGADDAELGIERDDDIDIRGPAGRIQRLADRDRIPRLHGAPNIGALRHHAQPACGVAHQGIEPVARELGFRRQLVAELLGR